MSRVLWFARGADWKDSKSGDVVQCFESSVAGGIRWCGEELGNQKENRRPFDKQVEENAEEMWMVWYLSAIYLPCMDTDRRINSEAPSRRCQCQKGTFLSCICLLCWDGRSLPHCR